jgi:hypothetical protein
MNAALKRETKKASDKTHSKLGETICKFSAEIDKIGKQMQGIEDPDPDKDQVKDE